MPCPADPGPALAARPETPPAPDLGPLPGDVVPELGQRRGEAGEERGVRGGEGGVSEELPGRRPHLGRPGLPWAARAPRGARPRREGESAAGARLQPAPHPGESRSVHRARAPSLGRPGNRLLGGRGFRAGLSRGWSVFPAALLLPGHGARRCPCRGSRLRGRRPSGPAAGVARAGASGPLGANGTGDAASAEAGPWTTDPSMQRCLPECSSSSGARRRACLCGSSQWETRSGR